MSGDVPAQYDPERDCISARSGSQGVVTFRLNGTTFFVTTVGESEWVATEDGELEITAVAGGGGASLAEGGGPGQFRVWQEDVHAGDRFKVVVGAGGAAAEGAGEAGRPGGCTSVTRAPNEAPDIPAQEPALKPEELDRKALQSALRAIYGEGFVPAGAIGSAFTLIAAYLAQARTVPPAASPVGELQEAVEPLRAWFGTTGESINRRWNTVPPEVRAKVVQALRDVWGGDRRALAAAPVTGTAGVERGPWTVRNTVTGRSLRFVSRENAEREAKRPDCVLEPATPPSGGGDHAGGESEVVQTLSNALGDARALIDQGDPVAARNVICWALGNDASDAHATAAPASGVEELEEFDVGDLLSRIGPTTWLWSNDAEHPRALVTFDARAIGVNGPGDSIGLSPGWGLPNPTYPASGSFSHVHLVRAEPGDTPSA